MKRRTVVSLVLCSLLVFVHSSTPAQWVQTNGPASGDVNALAAIGANLFAGSTQNGVFLSSNNGASWIPVNAGMRNTTVYAFAADGTRLFAGTDKGVFLSSNYGISWTLLNNGLDPSAVRALTMSGSMLAAGTEQGGVFLSSDGGANWTAANTGLSVLNVRALAAQGTELYAGTAGGGVFLSSDQGLHWSPVNSGLTNLNVNTLYLNGPELYAGTDAGGVFRSTDHGTSWTEINTGIGPLTKVRAIVSMGDTLFAGTVGAGVYRSSDHGSQWTLTQNGLPKINTLSFAVIGTDLFAGILGGGVFRSTDRAGSWTPVNNGMTTSIVMTLASHGTTLFAGMFRNHCYTTTDNGATWTFMNNGLTSVSVMSYVVAGSTVYAGTDYGVFSTVDDGAHWNAINNGFTPLYASALAANSTRLFAGTSSGIYASSDNGTNWTESDAGLPAGTYIHSLLAVGSTVLTGTAGSGIYRSTDNGATWTAANTGLPSASYVFALTAYGSTILAGTYGSGIFSSVDGGGHWNAINAGLTNLNVNAIAVNGGTLYAGTEGGVFVSQDNGASWTPLNDGLTNMTVKVLAVHGTGLYAGTEGSGVLRLELTDAFPVKITGNAGTDGAVLSWTDGTAKSVTSDADGNYSIAVSTHWSGTVTPSKTDYRFTPASRTYADAQVNFTAQNFGAVFTYTITGSTGGGGETLTWVDDTIRTTTASPSGAYTIRVPAHWSGTVTPSKLGYLFYPEERTYTDVVSNITSPAYSTWRGIIISGNAGAPGVVFTWYDGKQKSVVSDANGMYSITVSFSYNGTVTPSLPGCTFSPPRITYTSQRTDATNNNYQLLGSACVNAKVYLAGAFNGTAMSTRLQAQGYLPLSSGAAYDPSAYSYSAKSVASFPVANIVDWVLVELRAGPGPETRVGVQAGLIKSDGVIVDVDGTSQLEFSGVMPGSYYIVIRHRNHCAVMSASAVAVSVISPLYDFTTDVAKAYGTNPMTPLAGGSLYGLYGGDANRDGQITGSDYNIFSPRFSAITTGYEDADLNLDGNVTGSDYNVFSPNYAAIRSSAVPH